MVFGHLADHEVVLVVAGDRRHDIRPVRARVREGASFAAVLRDDDRADLIGDLLGAAAILLHEHDFVARFGEFAGQVVANFPAAHHQDKHPQSSPCPAVAPAPMGAWSCSAPGRTDGSLPSGSPIAASSASATIVVRQTVPIPSSASVSYTHLRAH